MFSIHMYVCIDILCVRKSSCIICICSSYIKYVTYMYTLSIYVCRYIYIYVCTYVCKNIEHIYSTIFILGVPM